MPHRSVHNVFPPLTLCFKLNLKSNLVGTVNNHRLSLWEVVCESHKTCPRTLYTVEIFCLKCLFTEIFIYLLFFMAVKHISLNSHQGY